MYIQRQISKDTQKLLWKMGFAKKWFEKLKQKYGEDEALVREAEPWLKSMDDYLLSIIERETHARRKNDRDS